MPRDSGSSSPLAAPASHERHAPRTFAEALSAYEPSSGRDAAAQDEAISFLASGEDAFSAGNLRRHFTGSCLLVDPREGTTLLTRHRKLGRWLHLGGHCDGVPDPFLTAWREAYEESGLAEVMPWSNAILHLDVHAIPAYRDIPEHLHYDVRYLFTADSTKPFAASEESDDLAWVRLDGLGDYTQEAGMLDMRDKAVRWLGLERNPA